METSIYNLMCFEVSICKMLNIAQAKMDALIDWL